MTIAWTKTASEVADDACRRVQMLGQGQTMSAYVQTRAFSHMNSLLKLLQTQGPNEWRRANQTVNLVQGQASYELDPRPDKVRDCFYVESASRELVMGRWNYDDYDMLPTKTQEGRPVVYTIDRQRTATNLVIWPTPDATAAALTIRVSYDRVMEDIVNNNDIVDVPQEWLDCFLDIVGGRMATEFRLENKSAEEVKARGAASLEALLGHDSEESITFTMGDAR